MQRTFSEWSKSAGTTKIDYILPTISGFTAKAISQTVTFPLEYMATLKQANITLLKKNLIHGFGYTLYRELLYSACFWTIQENLYKGFQKTMKSDANAYVTSGFLASAFSSILSYPFDLFKTWKISHPEFFVHGHPFSVARKIAKEKGTSVIFAGSTI